MFHIKTDIRQYKCESEHKVERLIRNWVIRPTDLIYDAQDESWKSIGEHAAFHALFVMIEKEEAEEPDTVVTEAPSEIAAEFEVSPGSELADDVSDADQTLVFEDAPSEDEEDAASQENSDQPGLPEAPEGVEGVIRDSDEITMMTDRTLEMLRDVDASSPGSESSTPAQAQQSPSGADPNAVDPKNQGRHGLPEEVFVTDEIYREDVHASILDDLGDLNGEDAEPSDAQSDDDEVTQLVERDTFFDDENENGSDDDSPKHAAPTDDNSTDDNSTDDNSTDDSSTDDDSTDDSSTDDDSTDAEKARWRIILEDAESEGVDRDDRGEDASEHDVSSEKQHDLDDAELDAMLNEAAALVGIIDDPADPAFDVENPEFIDAPSDDLESDEADSIGAHAQATRDRTKTPVRSVDDPVAVISGGYKLPLPVDVSPSQEALKRGLVHSRMSREAKNAAFPHPKPKAPGEISRRKFDLEPPPLRDQSIPIVIAIIVALVILLYVAVTFFG